MTIRWYSLDTDLRTVERGPVDFEGAYKIIDGYFARLRPQYQTGEEALAATMFGLRAWTGRTCRSASTPRHHRRGVRVQPRQERAPPFGRLSPSARRAAKVAGPATTSHQAVLHAFEGSLSRPASQQARRWAQRRGRLTS